MFGVLPWCLVLVGWCVGVPVGGWVCDCEVRWNHGGSGQSTLADRLTVSDRALLSIVVSSTSLSCFGAEVVKCQVKWRVAGRVTCDV